MRQWQGRAQQYVNGEWRDGRSTRSPLKDTNPYDGTLLTELRGASIDDAYAAADTSLHAWSATSARERSAVMRRAADLYWARRDEIVELTIRETGAVRTLAELLMHLGWTQLDAAATYPAFARGAILPTESPDERASRIANRSA